MRLLTAALLAACAGPASAGQAVTFADHVAPMIHASCTGCHRPGQPGPFSLITYKDVSKRARTIQGVLGSGYMPPWQPKNHAGLFKDERRLSESQKRLFDDWVAAGKPAGDLSRVRPPKFKSGWALGTPDLVVRMNGKFQVPADGPDVYRTFVVPVNLPEDKWVKAIEVRPHARGAVHHALIFTAESTAARRLDAADSEAGVRRMPLAINGRLGGYIPGTTPRELPAGLARKLPAGSDILLQTHFHPSGKPEVESAEVALYFSSKPPKRTMINLQLPPGFGRFAGIDVAAGESDYVVSDEFTLPTDVDAFVVGGHAHYICREMGMTAKLPDGSVKNLLNIQEWDLNWQDQYHFTEPVRLPKGTVITTRLVYDNSADNPENPFDPPQRIKWGRESTDEMGSVTLVVTAVDESETGKLKRGYRSSMVAKIGGNLLGGGQPGGRRGDKRRGGARGGAGGGLAAILKRLDRNGDGKLQKNEVPERLRDRLFGRLDKNQDGVVDQNEMKAFGGAGGRPGAGGAGGMMDKIFQRFDKNKDGKLQKAEVPQQLRERLFDRLDKNKDGVVEKGELAGLGGAGGQPGGAGGLKAVLDRFDKNLDGKLQKSEVPEQFRDRLFDRLDQNGDGVIDQAELDRLKGMMKKLGG